MLNIKELSLLYGIPEDELEELEALANKPQMVEAALKLARKTGGYDFKFAKKLVYSLNTYDKLAEEVGVDIYDENASEGEENGE